MPEDNALLNRINEISSYIGEISSAVDAGANVLDLETNEDSAELRAAWSQISSGLGRAKGALANLRAAREGQTEAAPAPASRKPIDDGD